MSDGAAYDPFGGFDGDFELPGVRRVPPIGTVEVVAQAKLPDDLGFEEYSQIISDLRTILGIPADLEGEHFVLYGGSYPEATVVRVQYGSDFMLVLTYAAVAAGFLYTVSKILKNVADAAYVNEQRMTSRQARLASMQQDPGPISYGFPDVVLPGPGSQRERTAKFTRSLFRLGRYQVRLHVVENEEERTSHR